MISACPSFISLEEEEDAEEEDAFLECDSIERTQKLSLSLALVARPRLENEDGLIGRGRSRRRGRRRGERGKSVNAACPYPPAFLSVAEGIKVERESQLLLCPPLHAKRAHLFISAEMKGRRRASNSKHASKRQDKALPNPSSPPLLFLSPFFSASTGLFFIWDEKKTRCWLAPVPVLAGRPFRSFKAAVFLQFFRLVVVLAGRQARPEAFRGIS